MVPEAGLERSDAGLVAASERWFVVNVRDAAWVTCISPCRRVEQETTSPCEAYEPFPGWQPGPPDDWNGLPWADATP